MDILLSCEIFIEGVISPICQIKEQKIYKIIKSNFMIKEDRYEKVSFCLSTNCILSIILCSKYGCNK